MITAWGCKDRFLLSQAAAWCWTAVERGPYFLCTNTQTALFSRRDDFFQGQHWINAECIFTLPAVFRNTSAGKWNTLFILEHLLPQPWNSSLQMLCSRMRVYCSFGVLWSVSHCLREDHSIFMPQLTAARRACNLIHTKAVTLFYISRSGIKHTARCVK